MPRQPKRKANLDDGCGPELVVGAEFDGIFDIPIVEPPSSILIPSGMTPYSRAGRDSTGNEMCVFFEKDSEFADVLIDPDACLRKIGHFPAIAQVDCSLYVDMPLSAQITNVYRSRAIASYWQRQGANVWPLARWGDERTYTTDYFPQPLAFAGIRHRSPVVVGAYGVRKHRDDLRHFCEGFEALINYVAPSIVLVYGRSRRDLYGHLRSKTEIHEYEDWTRRMRAGA